MGYVVDEVPQVILNQLYGGLDRAIAEVDNFDGGEGGSGVDSATPTGSGGDIGDNDGGNEYNQNVQGGDFNDGGENNGPGLYTDDNVNNYDPNGGNKLK